jgi:hypothetical protein
LNRGVSIHKVACPDYLRMIKKSLNVQLKQIGKCSQLVVRVCRL